MSFKKGESDNLIMPWWVRDIAGLSFILLTSSTGRVTQANKTTSHHIGPTVFFDPPGTIKRR
jgi:hypothetical protein